MGTRSVSVLGLFFDEGALDCSEDRLCAPCWFSIVLSPREVKVRLEGS
jgi:hypothetical protein